MGFTLSCAEVHEESWSSSPCEFAVHSEYLMTIMVLVVVIMMIMIVIMMVMMMVRVVMSQNT